MEVWSSHPNFKLSTILNLKDVRPIPKPKHTSIEKRKHESINTRFTQTDVRTLNGELENHCFFYFLCRAMQNSFDECNLNKHAMVLGKEIR
jgi:hypothetical protein